jgi:indole-3-glycerol phosphate synthase
MPNILHKIIAAKREEIDQARASRPVVELSAALADAPPVRDFLGALSGDGPIKLIAEVKKASPSKGIIREDFHPLEIATTYQQHGASCVSVLTDNRYFQGQLDYLTQIRGQLDLPLLRKDFILDEYQVLEARVAGADAVLLIAECLSAGTLTRLHDYVHELGMTPLVEFYEEENLPVVLSIGARLIGVNNRDLRTFHTDLQHTIRIRGQVPRDRLLVGESGIHSREDALKLQAAGVNAMLVGEHLMASEQIGDAVDRLLGNS